MTSSSKKRLYTFWTGHYSDDDDFIEQEATYFLDRTPFINQHLFCLAVVEGSTAISQFIQQVHDGIMRQCIGEYNGYEINTQGDAFEIAFLKYAPVRLCFAYWTSKGDCWKWNGPIRKYSKSKLAVKRQIIVRDVHSLSLQVIAFAFGWESTRRTRMVLLEKIMIWPSICRV